MVSRKSMTSHLPCEKACRKCGVVKAMHEYYVHKMMRDGTLNVCKSCVRDYQRERRAALLSDPAWVLMEKARCREKSKRTSPIKRKARRAVSLAIGKGILRRLDFCESCGSRDGIEAHHEDYSRPLDIKWLCKRCHTDVHVSRGDFLKTG